MAAITPAAMLTSNQYSRSQKLALQLAGIELFDRHREVLCQRLRRLGVNDRPGFEALLGAAEDDEPQAVQRFIALVTTNFTGFFRHPRHFVAAEHALWAAQQRGQARLWSAAAASGEEPYSLAMALIEVFRRPDPPATIVATDIILLAAPFLALVGLGLFFRFQLAGIEAGSRFVAETQISSLSAVGNISRQLEEQTAELTQSQEELLAQKEELLTQQRELTIQREQLTVSEERSRLILESSAEGIFGVDTEGRITFVNPAACQMLGFSVEELIGADSHAVIHHHRPDGSLYPKEECPMFAAYKEGKASRIDNESLWHKDGSGLPVEYGATPMLKDGVVVGAVVSFTDITMRKHAEAELQKRTNDLQHTNFLADSALNLTKAGYWHVPLDGSGWFNSSERAMRIFGDLPSPGLRYRLDEWAAHVREGDEAAGKIATENFAAAVAGTVPVYDAIYAYRRPVDGQTVAMDVRLWRSYSKAVFPPRYDVVLMDLQMPEMDGYQATTKIRSDSRFASLPIIAMTAHATIEERQRCLAAGMDDHVAKPIDPALLFGTLERYYKPTVATDLTPHPPSLGEDGGDSRRGLRAPGEVDLPAVEGLDTSDGLVRVAGNRTLYLKLLRQFVEEQGRAPTQIRTALAEGGTSVAERLAHTAKGVAGSLGASAVQRAAGILEKALATKAPSADVRAVLDDFTKVLEDFIVRLRTALPVPALAAAPAAPAAALDPAEARRIMQEMIGHLGTFDPAAGECLEAHRDDFRSWMGAERFSAFEQNVEGFAFAEALAQLQPVAQEKGMLPA